MFTFKTEQEKQLADAKAKNMKESIVADYEGIKQNVDVTLTKIDNSAKYLQEKSAQNAQDAKAEVKQNYEADKDANLAVAESIDSNNSKSIGATIKEKVASIFS